MIGRGRVGRTAGSAVAILLLVGSLGSAPARGHGGIQDTFDWDWGELFYNSTYQTVLTVTNDCDVPRTVHVFYAFGAPASPYVTAPLTSPTDRKSYVVPPGSTDIPITIQTPPAPTFTLPPPSSAHGVFVDIADPARAVLAVEHRGLPGCPRSCPDEFRYYSISGHIHFNPNPPADPLAVSPCRIWWDTGRKPAGLTRDCTQEIRALASAYRQLLISGVAGSPAWAWFPSLDAILSMSAEDLVALKLKADAQLAQSRVIDGAPAEGRAP
jgi:hypothetical protein